MEGWVTLIRYQIEKEDEPVCIISFAHNEDEIKVGIKPLGNKAMDIEEIRGLLEKLNIKDKSLSTISELCLTMLTEKNFSYRQIDSSDYQVSLQFQLGEGRQIGTTTPLVQGISETFGQTVMSDVLEKIKENAYNKLEEKANEILNLTQKDKHEEALELYQNSVHTSLYLAGTAPDMLIDTLFQIKAEQLCLESRIELSKQRIGLCDINKCYERAELDARWLLEQNESLPDDFVFNIRLTLGNALASQELFESAEFHYNKALEMGKEIDALSKAWAYHNIGSVLSRQGKMKEALESYTKAGDLWISKGDYQKAIRAYMRVIHHYENSQPQEAIRLLDKGIEHLVSLRDSGNEDMGISHILGFMYFHQGKIASELKRNITAKNAFVSSYNERKRLIGINDELEATLYYLMIVCKELNEQEEANAWEDKLKDIKTGSAKTEDSNLRKRIIALLNKNKDPELDTDKLDALKIDVEKMGTTTIKLMFWSTLAIRQIDENPDRALQSLDQAMKLNIERYPDEHMIVLRLYAEIMKRLNRAEKAYDYLCQAIQVKPTNVELYPEILFLAQELDKDTNAKLEHALAWTKIDEDNMDAWLFIGSQYERLEQPRKAYDAFNKALAKAPLEPDVQEKIKQAVHRVTDKVMTQSEVSLQAIPTVEDFLNKPIDNVYKTIQERLSERLTDFQKIIERYHRSDFWRYENKKIKWIPSPEKKAQQYLLLYLRTQLHPDIEVLEEVPIGEGRMDVYIKIPPGINLVLEIKMCGEGYSSTYAKGGIEQTRTYMEKKDCNLGYLIIFDARKRDMGIGFEPLYRLDNKQIYSQIIDLRHKLPSNK